MAAHGTTEKCPFCDASVRRDRLELHAKNVHPNRTLEKETVDRLRRSSQGGVPRIGKGKIAPGLMTRRRWLLLGVGVTMIALVVYAVVHVPTVPQAQVGQTAPDFTFADLAGTSHSLSSFQGHPLVLWWVALFCSSCSQGTQYFSQSYYSQYHASGVLLVEVEDYNDLGQPGPSLSTFASQNGYSGQSGWVLGQGSSSGTTAYNPNGYLDVYYVISSSGTVVASGQVLPGAFSTALQQAVAS